MSNSDPGTAGAPAASAGQPQAGTAADPTATPAAEAPPAGDQASAEERISLDEAKKLRQEAHSLRQRLAAAERKNQEHADAQLNDQQRLEKRATEAEQRLAEAQAAIKEKSTRLAVERAAHSQRFIDPRDAFKLLDEIGPIEYGEDGEPKNVDTLLKALIKSKPYLVQPEPTTAAPPEVPRPMPIGATPRPASAAAMNEAMLRAEEAAAARHVKRLV